MAWSANAAGTRYRPFEIGRLVLRHRLLAPLDLALHLPYAVDILIEARTIGNAHTLLDLSYVCRE